MSWDVSIQAKVEVPHLDQNITYNVGPMLRRAGLHPRILHGMTVVDAQPIFKEAVILMAENPDYFRQFNAENGWGTFETTFVAVDTIYKALCEVDDLAASELRLRWH